MHPWRVSTYALMLAAAGLPLYIHLPRYATGELGLSLATLGVILAGIRVMDFAQDPALGWLVDRYPARKPTFAALAALGMGLGFVMLYTLRPESGTIPWLIAALVLVFTAYSLGTILFYGQSAPLAGSPEGLIRLAGYREAGTLGGIILAATAPTALIALGAPGSGYSAFGLLLAAICLIALVVSRPLWRVAAPAERPLSLADLRTSGALGLLALAFVNALPVAITSTLFLFFVEDRLNLPDLAGPFLILFFLAAGLSVPLWTRASARFGPTRVLVPAMGLAILAFIGAAALPMGAALGFALICLGSGAALGADMVILPVLFASALDRAGLQAGRAFGLWSFAAKLALASAAVLLLPLLEISGYRPGTANSDAALIALTLAYAVLPCLIKCAAIVLALQLPREEVPA